MPNITVPAAAPGLPITLIPAEPIPGFASRIWAFNWTEAAEQARTMNAVLRSLAAILADDKAGQGLDRAPARHGRPAACLVSPRRRPRSRTAARAFPPMPVDLLELRAANLQPTERAVLLGLWGHVWTHGSLPTEPRELAAIGGVQVRTWRAMEETLAAHFDIDEQGRWRHCDYEEMREAAFATRAARVPSSRAAIRSAVAVVVPPAANIREEVHHGTSHA